MKKVGIAVLLLLLLDGVFVGFLDLAVAHNNTALENLTQLPQNLPPITASNLMQLAVVKEFRATDYGNIYRDHFLNLAFSPDGVYLAGLLDSFDVIIDISTDKAITKSNDRGLTLFRDISYSPDGKFLLTGDDMHLIVWDIGVTQIAMKAEILDIRGSDEYAHFEAFSANSDGSQVFAVTQGQSGSLLHIWDVLTGREIDRLQIPECSNSSAIGFTSDGRILVCNRYAPNVTSYDTQTKELISNLPHSDTLSFETVQDGVELPNSDGSLLVSNQNGQLLLYGGPFENRLLLPHQAGRTVKVNNNASLLGVANGGDRLWLYGIVGCLATASHEVNLRPGPNTDSTIGGVFPVGERIAIVGQTNQDQFTWWSLANGLWVRSDIVNAIGPACDSIPRVQ